MTVEELRQLPVLEYYKWHWQRFRANRRVQRMDYIARGLYRELLDEQWVDGSIPNDIAELADICGCPVEVMQDKWPQIAGCFLQDEETGRLYNQTLEDQRTAKDAQRIRLAKNGSSGGSQKAFNAKLELATSKQSLANASNCQGSVSNCHIEEKSREEKSKEKTNAHRKSGDERGHASESKVLRLKDLTAWAERCHAAYPRKVAKQDSLRAFIKHISKVATDRKISDDEAGSYMLGRVEAYRDSPLVSSTPADKIPYPASWVNAGHYEDPAEAWRITTATQRGTNAADTRSRAQVRQDNSFAAIDAAFERYIGDSGKGTDGANEGELPQPGANAGDERDMGSAMVVDGAALRSVGIPACADAFAQI